MYSATVGPVCATGGAWSATATVKLACRIGIGSWPRRTIRPTTTTTGASCSRSWGVSGRPVPNVFRTPSSRQRTLSTPFLAEREHPCRRCRCSVMVTLPFRQSPRGPGDRFEVPFGYHARAGQIQSARADDGKMPPHSEVLSLRAQCGVRHQRSHRARERGQLRDGWSISSGVAGAAIGQRLSLPSVRSPGRVIHRTGATFRTAQLQARPRGRA